MTEKRASGAALFAASVGLSAVLTTGYEPMEVLIGWSVSALLTAYQTRRKKPFGDKLPSILRLIMAVFVLAAVIQLGEKAFPQEQTYPFVSVALAMLVWRSMQSEKDSVWICGGVLGLCIIPLMAAPILFGMQDLNIEYLIPDTPELMPVLITVLATTPWWVPYNKVEWGWYSASGATAVLFSILATGMLGRGLVEHTAAPLYKAVQGIHFLGKLQRFEALVAAAELIGIFCVLGIIGCRVKEDMERLTTKCKKKYISGILLAAVLFVEYAGKIIWRVG